MSNLPRGLQRLLKKVNCTEEAPPKTKEAWSQFLEGCSTIINEVRERMEIQENSLAVSVAEMERLLVESKKSATAKLIKSEELFRTVFEASPNPYLFFNSSGILDCNRAAVSILNAQDKLDVLSRHPVEFSPEFQPDGTSSKEKALLMNKMARENGRHQFEWQHQTFDGQELPVEVTLAPVHLNGEMVLLTLWRDLRIEKLTKANLLHNTKMSSLGEMAGGIAHEINNPLMIISGKTEKIIRDIQRNAITTDILKVDVDKIQEIVIRVSKIIKGLKTFTRDSNNDPTDRVCIHNLFKDTFELCRERFATNSITLKIEPAGNNFVNCRASQISQVILNLLSNSFDAIHELPDRWVHIKIENKGNTTVVSVTDSGGGLTPEVQSKLMQPFYTTKPVGKGTGLGLSISKNLIEAHGGKLYFDKSSKNTCFKIELPSSYADTTLTNQAS